MKTLEEKQDQEQENRWFKDLSIDDSSPFALSEELKHHSQKAAEYRRLYAHATKKVADLKLELDVLVATLVQRIYYEAQEKGKPLPETARGEIRKTRIPLDARYQDKRTELNEAKETSDLLRALSDAFNSRSGRLRDLSQVMNNLMQSNPRLFDKRGPQLKTKMREAGKLLDYGDEEC